MERTISKEELRAVCGDIVSNMISDDVKRLTETKSVLGEKVNPEAVAAIAMTELTTLAEFTTLLVKKLFGGSNDGSKEN